MTNEQYEVYYEKYKNLIYKMSLKFNLSSTCLEDDLIQCGKIGLYRAIETFNPDKGSTLTTWVNTYVKKEMTQFLSNNLTTIRRPAHLSNVDGTIIQTISTATIISEEDNETIEDRISGDVNGQDESLDDKAQLNLDIINATKLTFKAATQEVLRLRLEENLNWRQIAKKMGISHQLASNKYQSAIKKLKIAVNGQMVPNKTK